MSTQLRQIEDVKSLVRKLYGHEHAAKNPVTRTLWGALRWAAMLYHEYVRDNVRVRAESLSYLMLFSFLPLVAGGFFIVNIFAQFGMVQEALGGFLNRFLETIPEEHREFVLEYALKFKDAYLASLGAKSGTLGIFALFFLAWVGLKVYVNVDRTLNDIWSSDHNRPWLEQARNFLVVSIVAPLVLTATLSIPLVLHRIPVTQRLLDSVPLVWGLLNWGLPLVIVMGVLAFLYRFVPVRRVRWSSALAGGLFAGTALQIANLGMNLYFRLGTQTAYGKAAVLPLIGFWIYVVWVIVILGAELSYLMQNGQDLVRGGEKSRSLHEAESLVPVLLSFYEALREGRNPVRLEDLRVATGLSSSSLRQIIDHLAAENLVLEVQTDARTLEGEYALSRDLGPLKVSPILQKFLGKEGRLGPQAHQELWKKALAAWASAYGELTFGDLARQVHDSPQ